MLRLLPCGHYSVQKIVLAADLILYSIPSRTSFLVKYRKKPSSVRAKLILWKDKYDILERPLMPAGSAASNFLWLLLRAGLCCEGCVTCISVLLIFFPN